MAVTDHDSWVLIDCGRGATLRTIAAGLDLTQLVGVFLTHHHSDHISDLATLAIARWSTGCAAPLAVHAPDGPAARFAETCLDAFDDDCFHSQADSGAGPRPRIEVHRFAPTSDVTTVMDTQGWTLRTALVDHHPIEPATGYRIERSGVAIMVSGDTRVCDGVRALAHGAHVVVHEALLGEWASSAHLVGRRAGCGSARFCGAARHPRPHAHDPRPHHRKRRRGIPRRRTPRRLRRSHDRGSRPHPNPRHPTETLNP